MGGRHRRKVEPRCGSRTTAANRVAKQPFAAPACLGKAARFDEWFREVAADPVNLLINRVPEAG